MRYFFLISYKGNKYKGWQKQTNVKGCIQDVLEATLEKVYKIPFNLVGCGRTDAGVHASSYYAHSDFEGEIDLGKIDIINFALPNDIVVHEIYPTMLHARFDALQREYVYKMHFQLDPFLDELSSYYNIVDLDYEKVNEACLMIKNQTEFTNFCKSPQKQLGTNCKIFDCHFVFDHQYGKFTIRANRFLKSMVRILVNDLIRIGRRQLSIKEFEGFFDANNHRTIEKIAHPQGLYLSEIVYKNTVDSPKAYKFGDLKITL
jgi:tRNA pseudouridine38-40 synthase